MKDFSPETLLQTARERTGLNDFGGDDFREGFEIIVTSLAKHNQIPDSRHDQLREYFLRLLINRLWFAKDLNEHPEIAEQELLPPLLIISLPRTGTSKLQRMLGATGDFQNLLFWQGHMFARIPGESDGGVKQRIARTYEYVDWRLSNVPDYNQGHPMYPEEPDEDPILSEHAFYSGLLATAFNSPEYLEWMAKTDDSYLYDYLRLQLKYLQWQFNADGRKPWLIKSVVHLGNEAKIDRIFPNGYHMLFSHRMPDEVLPSAAKVLDLMQQEFNSDLGAEFGKGRPAALVMQMFAQGLLAHLEWRKTKHNANIIDVSFRDVTRNAIGVAQLVYERIGMPFSDETEAAIAEWEKENPQNKHGKHGATLEEYGMDRDQILENLLPYTKQFSHLL